MFLKSNANSLSLYHKQNYLINLMKERISLFNFIYNFLKKKLTKLCKYLNNFKSDFI